MSGKDLDPVEWELVRADIAMEKARLKANGDWSKWEAFQAQTNARFGGFVTSAASRERQETPAAGGAVRGGFRPSDLWFLIAPFRRLTRGGCRRR